LVLGIILLTFVFLPLGFLLNRCGLLLQTQSRYKSDIESVSLLVANDLAKIVINDPHFGFVSISNRPPIGNATLAADGEPCPVTSINTLMATIRLDSIIAHESGGNDLCQLADTDYNHAKQTTRLLQSTLNLATKAKPTGECFDMNGKPVALYADAEKLLRKNLQANNGGHPVSMRNLRISLGWLRDGGPTNTPLPQPHSLAHVQEGFREGGKYRACVDASAFGNSYFFAPAARAASLTDERMFAPPDGQRFCSVVKVEADIEDTNIFDRGSGQKWLHVAACAIPPDSLQMAPTGALLIFFPCELVPALKNLSDLLCSPNGYDPQSLSYKAVNGDFPLDPAATTVPASLAPWTEQDINCNRVIALGIYGWLRASGIRPRIDSALKALQTDFNRSLKSSNLLYEFDLRGNVVISSLPSMPLPISVLSDEQVFVETRGQNYTVACYDNVYNLGTVNGGKHAGQPLAGDPINWCDLPCFGLSADAARSMGKGPATGLSATNDRSVDCSIPGAVLNNTAQFEVNGKLAAVKPRKSYYGGGLAVELSVKT
jgi:hypothetical protein